MRFKLRNMVEKKRWVDLGMISENTEVSIGGANLP